MTAPSTDLDPTDAVWVTTTPGDRGGYVVRIDAGRGRTRVLNPKTALAHAAGCLAAAARAEHDAAIARQISGSLDDRLDAEEGRAMVAGVVDAVRQDRPDLKLADTHPLELTPGVSADHRPFITLRLVGDSRPCGQWDPAAARQHAEYVVEAVAVADLDAGYYRALRAQLDLSDATARQMVDAIATFRDPLIEVDDEEEVTTP